MNDSGLRTATIAVMGLRIAFGAGLIAVPKRLATRWLGSAAASAPTQVPLRALGTREIVLSGVGLAAAVRGRAVRPWLAALAAGDLTDVAATIVGRRELPRHSAPLTALVGGGSAAICLALAAAAEE